MHLEGTPSDLAPEVLATGRTDARYVFMSMSARHPDGRDGEYIEWHSLDHRPEQYRLAGIRNAIRLVSTPAARAARAASTGIYDAIDHVMNYQFADSSSIGTFFVLGDELNKVGRMAIRLPSLGYLTADLVSIIAAPHAVAGADVIPWRPTIGVYLIIEEGHRSADDLIDVPGVAGIWTYHCSPSPAPFQSEPGNKQITYLFLDQDPVDTATALNDRVRQRWQSGETTGLLAAPFYTIVPYEWDRNLPA